MTSIFDLFKIGIGPSSSHTVGPMRAARAFTQNLDRPGTARIQTELYGSLALTGRGHGTDRAIILGLLGEEPDRIDPARIDPLIAEVRRTQKIHTMDFEESRDLLFRGQVTLPGHPSAMRFTAFDSKDALLKQDVYYSIGGGFIVREGESTATNGTIATVPYPFSSAAELLNLATEARLLIWQLVLENEKSLRSEIEIRERLTALWNVMQECTQRGFATEGTLPGGLNVRRRAPSSTATFETQIPSTP